MQDTLGRVIQFETGPNSPPEVGYHKRYTIIDSNGNPETWQLNYIAGADVCSPLTVQHIASPVDQLKSIKLPNGKEYSFEYNHTQGFLTDVTLPTGGKIHYGYPDNSCIAGMDYISSRSEDRRNKRGTRGNSLLG